MPQSMKAASTTEKLGYWCSVLAPILLHGLVAFYLWSHHQGDGLETGWEAALDLLKYAWFIPLFWALFNLGGLLQGAPNHGNPTSTDVQSAEAPPHLLIVAYVSRGENQQALSRAMRRTQSALDRTGHPYAIEVVSDLEIAPHNRVVATEGKIDYYLVPPHYETKSRVKYKARALQYLLEQRNARLGELEDSHGNAQNVWVLHLDEESVLSQEAIAGIQRFITKHSLTHSDGAIGQGEILYNAYDYGKHTLITAVDSLRTGDDLGRFRFQYRWLHRPVCGMHGSFVLAPAAVERAIGWDWGGRSSITEDAYFALKAMEAGVRFDWVHGFIQEQSPFSVRDLIKQRTRWFTGLSLIVADRGLKLSSRVILGLFMVCWAASWISCLVTFLAFAVAFLTHRNAFPLWAALGTASLTGVIGAVYMVGAYRNALHSKLSIHRKAFLLLATYLLWLFQVAPLIETAAVLHALYRAAFDPVQEFTIVEKNQDVL